MSKENILGTLVVVVLKAQHLIDNHTFYKQNPYAKLSLSGATKQTPPDPKGGQHPVWDAELRFPISKDASKNNRTLTISVFAEERKEDELLGEGTIDITDTLKSGEFDGAPPFSLFGRYRFTHSKDRLGAFEPEGHPTRGSLSRNDVFRIWPCSFDPAPDQVHESLRAPWPTPAARHSASARDIPAPALRTHPSGAAGTPG